MVPYRPIARRQVSVPHRPSKAPPWGSTMIKLGGGDFGASRPIGMMPMAKIKFQKPVFLKMGYRKE